MAVVRRTPEQICAHRGMVDHAKLDATTEADIRRHMIEDGEDPDAPARVLGWYVSPAIVRARLSMSQAQFAAAIGVPVATLRN